MLQDGANSPSALGMDGKTTALLGYIIGIIAIISLVIEKNNRFVRFHAFQSLFLLVAYIISIFALMIIGGILGIAFSAVSSTLGGLIWLIVSLGYLVLIAAFLGGLIYSAIKAFGGNYFKLPIIGNFAEKFSNK